MGAGRGREVGSETAIHRPISAAPWCCDFVQRRVIDSVSPRVFSANRLLRCQPGAVIYMFCLSLASRQRTFRQMYKQFHCRGLIDSSMNQRLRDNRCKVAPRGQANRPTKLDWSRSAKYRFVDLCHRLAGHWPSARPGLNWKGKRSPFLKGFPRGRPFLLPPTSI
jgi:hypothetical protein